METILLLTDFVLLLFWVRLWSLPHQELYFNPFLSAPTRLTDQVLDFLRPVLPLPGRLLALCLILFLLAFRAVSLHHFCPDEPWVLNIGAILNFSPNLPGMHGAMAFSALHFLFFVANYWGIYVLTQLLTPVMRRDRASEALHVAALPLAALRRWAQILLLLAVHGVLMFELSLVGTFYNPLLPVTASFNPWLNLACLSLISLADLLKVAWQLMFGLLMGSFAASLLQNPALSAICTESVATLLGTRKRLLVGLIDLTPLLYMASLYLLYTLIVLPCLFSMLKICR